MAKKRKKKKSKAPRQKPARRARAKKKRARRRRFTLPTGKTLYASPDRYPRLYEWIANADVDEE